MGLRDLALAIVFFGALPIIPFRPFLGLIVFSWLAYLRPQNMSWVLGSVQFSLYTTVAMLLGLALGHLIPSVVPRERLASVRILTVWMFLMWLWVVICSQLAVDPGVSTRRLDTFTKLIIIAILTTGLVRTFERFRVMILVIGLSLGALGLKFALFGIVRGGSVFTSGPGGFMVDNNSFALCLNMALPLLAGIVFVDEKKWLRVTAMVLAVGSAITIIFTFSRGGLLTLAVVATLLVWTSGRRLLSASVLLLAGAGFFLFAGESFEESYFERAGTIASYEEDASARGRLEAWGTAMEIAEDYPLTGVGPGNLYVVHSDYSDLRKVRVTHNSFLQFLVDTGYPGLVLLAGLLLLTIYRLQVVRARHREEWVRTYARMLQISITAYIIGASLLDMAYLDLIYHLIAMAVALEVAAQTSSATARPSVTADEGPPKPWYLVEPAGTRAT